METQFDKWWKSWDGWTPQMTYEEMCKVAWDASRAQSKADAATIIRNMHTEHENLTRRSALNMAETNIKEME